MLPNKSTKRIMDFIRGELAQGRPAPTLREIRDGAEISTTSVVDHHVQWLRNDGQIDFDAGKSRTIRLAGQSEPEVIYEGMVSHAYVVPVGAGRFAEFLGKRSDKPRHGRVVFIATPKPDEE